MIICVVSSFWLRSVCLHYILLPTSRWFRRWYTPRCFYRISVWKYIRRKNMKNKKTKNTYNSTCIFNPLTYFLSLCCTAAWSKYVRLVVKNDLALGNHQQVKCVLIWVCALFFFKYYIFYVLRLRLIIYLLTVKTVNIVEYYFQERKKYFFFVVAAVET